MIWIETKVSPQRTHQRRRILCDKTTGQCVICLREVGFSEIQTATEELGYYYLNLDIYWEEDVMSSMQRIPLEKLDPEMAERVRVEQFEESVLRQDLLARANVLECVRTLGAARNLS